MGDLTKGLIYLGQLQRGSTSYILKLVQFKQVSKSTQVSNKFPLSFNLRLDSHYRWLGTKQNSTKSCHKIALPISSGAVCIPITSKKLSRMSLREVCSEKLKCKQERKKEGERVPLSINDQVPRQTIMQN